jgi:hypothetical protein
MALRKAPTFKEPLEVADKAKQEKIDRDIYINKMKEQLVIIDSEQFVRAKKEIETEVEY